MSDDDFELAQGARPSSTFPAELGFPPGRPYSEERGRWLREKVKTHVITERFRHLADANGRALILMQRALLRAKRNGPR